MYNSESSTSSQLNPWQQWAFRIEQRLQEQQDTIDTLQATVSQLEQQLTDQKQNHSSSNPPIFHVDKIEYHFDQLKVETLEGSLQIGMSTASSSQLPTMIEELAMKQKNVHGNSPHPNSKVKVVEGNTAHNLSKPIKTSVHSSIPSANNAPPTEHSANLPAGFEQYLSEQLRTYLHEQGVSYIRKMSSQLDIPIDDDHITQIIVDLENQIEARIHHYVADEAPSLTRIAPSSDQELQHEWEKIERSVSERTWHDIETAIRYYLQEQAVR
ncbi:MAG: spore germination protein GerPC [Candidatus Pristimantibacillus lignocellulolyticus]|uniref:Spore germination protein GerPC n=1 Tax=Candidatus Pristimantibacillus lignocellulolyticus TaxID=2994561 RepID=A0A9J6ZEG7_9BACL|nr:MAG: spore germination protein GerPC [Candidatus Pristimantibacillus lignocellulolyticus]